MYSQKVIRFIVKWSEIGYHPNFATKTVKVRTRPGPILKRHVGESAFLKHIWGGCVEAFFVITCNSLGTRPERFTLRFVPPNGVFISGVIIPCTCADDINHMNATVQLGIPESVRAKPGVMFVQVVIKANDRSEDGRRK